ncbi:MAG: bifunctional precorrin-2 dehydrogenase/sirohydrochlorin ferrochelatase [Peptococcaceae bacterium]|nr:bifunctional precorrin-2 dehydrogenase/sirohydrochlorin ferrochelatase [Peptococcaceae bacterium]
MKPFSYSVMLDLHGKTALVAGGGDVAVRKVRTLCQVGAKVIVIAPKVNSTLTAMAEKGTVSCLLRPVKLEDIDVFAPFVVFAATDDVAVNRALAAYCQRQQILVNSITEPEHGNFAVQATIRKDDFAVSVSTYGQGAGFSKALKAYLEAQLDERFDRAVAIYIGIRQWLMETVDDSNERLRLVRGLSLETICEMMDEGVTEYDELFERVKEWLSCSLD